jgi:glycosyltransferase involved in cell wall biosynthesis
MKVGLFLNSFSPSLGGGFTIEEDIVASVSRLRHETRHEFVIVPQPDLVMEGEGFKNLPVVRFAQNLPCLKPVWKRVLNTARGRSGHAWDSAVPLSERQVGEQLQSAGIEFLVSPGPLIPTMEIPFALTVWDLQHRLQPFFPEVSVEGWPWEARETHYRNRLGRATAVISGTEAGSAEIQRFYGVPAKRIFRLWHPTPSFALHAGEPNPKLLEEQGIEPGYLYYPAQFWSHKNHVAIIRGLAYLREQYSLRPRVVCVGSDQGNLGYVKQQIREFGLEEQFRLLGFVSRELLLELYRHAEALVYPSFFGPENLPPLEAFALGCPVIASSVSGSEEQLSGAADLFDPTNEVELAEAIRHVLEDREHRAQMIERGKLRAHQFTGDDFARGIFGIVDWFERYRRCWGVGERGKSRE